MASYLQIENISKSYGTKILFENIGFNINEGDKIALIAPNGTGKTSLMRIIAGQDKSDSGGQVRFLKNIRTAFLEQDYSFDPQHSITQELFTGDFEQELAAKKILDNFGLAPEMRMGDLSGGEVKRVAITKMLASQADFFIMDEPTNHLDTEAIEYLESYLTKSRSTLFMVTHDRYFLDRVCNIVMEMDRGSIYTYRGDYENYLQKRQERIDNYNAETDRVRNILRRELEWIHATPCARSGKAKYRINAFHELSARAENTYTESRLSLSDVSTGSRLGSKIINCKNVSFYWGQDCYLKDFTYNFARGEKLGIVGRNGFGKSTFINLLLGNLNPDSGIIERGESLKIGYYRQQGMDFDEDQTVLETVNDTRLLSQFLFPHDMLNNRISRLSGGEKRRLYLLTILMQNPNLLVLDEPTNDLDIVTLNILEEYLKDFKGSLIIVSHDRHFLDRLAEHLLVFCGDGVVKDFYGTYTEYRSYIRDYEKARKAAAPATPGNSTSEFEAPAIVQGGGPQKKRKLSYKEQRELEQLEKDMEMLNAEKSEIETKLSGATMDYTEITKLTERFAELKALLDEKELRWLELSEI